MRVVCAVHPEDAAGLRPDVLVLPEGIPFRVLDAATRSYPKCIVVAAVRDRANMRAHVVRNGTNVVDYLKILSDGRSKGVGRLPLVTVYHTADVSIGVMICRDVECNEFRLNVLEQFSANGGAPKIICIPGDMHGDWFSSEPLLGFRGAFVAMSNNVITYPDWRAPSFIADDRGFFVTKQTAHEAVCASVP